MKKSLKARFEETKEILIEEGYEIVGENGSCLEIKHRDSIVRYFVAKEWATGKTIVDGRGFKHLLAQLRKKKEPVSSFSSRNFTPIATFTGIIDLSASRTISYFDAVLLLWIKRCVDSGDGAYKSVSEISKKFNVTENIVLDFLERMYELRLMEVFESK